MNNRGMGYIGISIIFLIMLFFFAGFFTVMELLYSNVLSNMILTESTRTYYDSYIHPLFYSFAFLFLLSTIIWGLVQTQSPYNMSTIAAVWIVVLVAYFVMSAVFVSFDKLIMEDLLDFVPVDQHYYNVYVDLVKPLWRATPLATYLVLVFFGVYMASTYAEKAGTTSYGFGGRRY